MNATEYCFNTNPESEQITPTSYLDELPMISEAHWDRIWLKFNMPEVSFPLSLVLILLVRLPNYARASRVTAHSWEWKE